MMACLATAAAAAACAHLGVARWVMEMPAEGEPGHLLERGLEGSLFNAMGDMLRDPRRSLLLAGVGLSAALVALHSAAVPSLLGGLAASPEDPRLLAAAEAASGSMGIAVLACGALADGLAEHWAAKGLAVAQVASALGLRALVGGLGSAQPLIAAAGLFASYCGLGGYLGLAAPVVLRLTRGASALPARPAAAAASAALGCCWFLGDAWGAGLQLALLPALGHGGMILAFAVVLAAHGGVVLVQPWQQSKAACQGPAGWDR